MEGITLFSSDSRPKYINDVLNVLALPEGAHYQFRYRVNYVPSAIANSFAVEPFKDIPALVAFRSTTEGSNAGNFIAPIRWVSIYQVERIADFYVVHFSIRGYPVILEDCRNSETNQYIEKCVSYLESLTSNIQKLPVHRGFTSLVDTHEQTARDSWVHICRCLEKYDAFKSIHFLRINSFSFHGSGLEIKLNNHGELVCDDTKYLNIKVDYFTETFPCQQETIDIETEEAVLRSASRKKIEMNSRYDMVQFLLQSLKVQGETKTEITIETRCNSQEGPQTSVSIPVIVKKSYFHLIPTLLTVLGAAVVSVPGMLDNAQYNLSTLVSIAIAGALLIGIGTTLKK